MKQTLNEAIKVLKETVKGSEPVNYWVRGNAYIFRVKTADLYGCNFWKVEGSSVTGTNPILSDLDSSDMKNV